MGAHVGNHLIVNTLRCTSQSEFSQSRQISRHRIILNGPFGLFNENGMPQKNFYAMQAFNTLLKTPRRVTVAGSTALLTMEAGVNDAGTEAAILIANLDQPQTQLRLVCTNPPWHGATRGTVRVVDAAHNFDEANEASVEADGTVVITLRRPAVALISLRAGK